MESATCNNCNIKTFPTAIFCHKCGRRLKCENCGAFLVKDANNCISCGMRTTEGNKPNTATKNTVTYRRTKDEIFLDASLTNDVAKDGISSLISSITNNRLPEGKFSNKEIDDFESNTNKGDSDTIDIDLEKVVEKANDKDTSIEFPHISDVEKNVNCSETEWILIYAFYESEYNKNHFTKDAVYNRYMLKRKSRSHLANFSKNWKSLFKDYFSTISDDEIKFKTNDLSRIKNLVNGVEKGTIKSINKKRTASKIANAKSNVTSNSEAKSNVTKTKNKPGISVSYNIETSLNLHPKGKQSFKDFYLEYQSKSSSEVILLIVYYIRKVLNSNNINENTLYTCYKEINLPVPSLKEALSNIQNRKGWIDTSDRSDLKLTISGENYIEHTMKKVVTKIK